MLNIKSVTGGYVDGVGFVVGWDDENGTSKYVTIKEVDAAGGVSPRILCHALRALLWTLEEKSAEGTK